MNFKKKNIFNIMFRMRIRKVSKDSFDIITTCTECLKDQCNNLKHFYKMLEKNKDRKHLTPYKFLIHKFIQVFNF